MSSDGLQRARQPGPASRARRRGAPDPGAGTAADDSGLMHPGGAGEALPAETLHAETLPEEAGADEAGGPAARDPEDSRLLRLTDARAMRALAHPVRMALLEALAHAGTLTATQASEALGESPANCAFHLRTLAKYGYVEEAGGGKGRERPWRRSHVGFRISSAGLDPQAEIAADEVAEFWFDTLLARARAALARRRSWPAEWQDNGLTGASEDVLYVTPEEAREVSAEIRQVGKRFEERLDHPERRPPGAMPIEVIALAYPLLHLAARPAPPPAQGEVIPADPESELSVLAEGAPCIPSSPAGWLMITTRPSHARPPGDGQPPGRGGPPRSGGCGSRDARAFLAARRPGCRSQARPLGSSCLARRPTAFAST
jgi:DNA-binding transcriptional ArsR family regulator